MPVSVCENSDSSDGYCGSPCSELSDVEKRRINRQLFMMPVSVCENSDSSDGYCGSPCSELSDVEKRRINRQLFMAFPPEEARVPGQRMFVFIRGYDSLLMEDVEESDVFFHADKCAVVKFDHEGCSVQSREPSENLYRWMRVVPFIVHGKV
ncbi:hypothetical protein DICVIV_07890 [Dictyocaulus viviparus]|uniref:Uncharacterized protein n=1 Tax=Dictyocaulus viviparus TaxID=29172 RepID=A0A0D8XNB6_DICVI|nr:hypothetical protein DICVIV_07890 [Dictyocaulus viviparus]